MMNAAIPLMSSFLFFICFFAAPFPAIAGMGDVPINTLIFQAKNGNPEAQDELGFRYASGLDVSEDFAEAARWYLAAAEKGHVKAQNEIGAFYEKGIGVPRDPAKAVYWYEKAATQGYPPAQYHLSLKLSAGEGVKKDEIRSTMLLRKAAEGGLAMAEYNLGVQYINGLGVKKDFTEAAKFFRKSADHGYHYAMFNLANSYLRGAGVKKDLVKAYMWLYLSIGGGAKQKELSKKIETRTKMSRSEYTTWLYALNEEDLRRAHKGLELLRQSMTDVQVSSAIQQANDWSPTD